jgi:hypothetical protein
MWRVICAHVFGALWKKAMANLVTITWRVPMRSRFWSHLLSEKMAQWCLLLPGLWKRRAKELGDEKSRLEATPPSLPTQAPHPHTRKAPGTYQATRVQTCIRPVAMEILCSRAASSRSRCSRVLACTSSSVAIPNLTMSGSRALVASATWA